MANVESSKYCQTCGEEIHSKAVICPECGVEQPQTDEKESDSPESFTDAYPVWAWIAGVFLTIFAFGWGLMALAYFVVKSTRTDFEGQSTAEIVTVLVLALLGIIVVEIGGESGTRKFWRYIAYAILGLFALSVLFALVGAIGQVL